MMVCLLPLALLGAQDQSLAQMNMVSPAFYTAALSSLETIEKQQILSWKEKKALKIAKKKIAKAEQKIKQGKKTNFLGGLIALVVIGLILIPIGAFILLPLLVIGIIVLALGIVGSVFRGLGRIF